MKNLTQLMEVQKTLQTRLKGNVNESISITQTADEIMLQQQYLLDEVTEVLTALGGAYGKASWKSWKKDHERLKLMTLKDLSPRERRELVDECADVMIFIMNIINLCEVEGDVLLQAIDRKQGINVERWESGY